MIRPKKAATKKKQSSAKSATETLASQFRAAALQRRLVEPWLNDRNFIDKERGTILYAADSDVVKLFTDPYSVSVAQGSRHGYAEIIPGQDVNVSEALGWILANFIFTKLSGEWPVFLLPPAQVEVSDIFGGVAREAKSETAKALVSMRRLEKWIEANQKTAIDKKYFENHLTEILAVIAGGKGPSAELVRFSRLLNSEKLFTLDQYLVESRLPDETLREALASPVGIQEMVEFSLMIDNWKARIEEEIEANTWPTRKPENNDVDARMLARLEWINNKLDGNRFRLVLITGSHFIDQVSHRHEDKHFGDRFIRSPKAYLGDPSVISPILDTEVKEDLPDRDYAVGRRLQDWLNTVLGVDEREYRDRASYLKLIDSWIASGESDLRRLATEKLVLNSRLASEIDEKWRAFAKEVSTMAAQTETQRRLNALNKEFLPVRDQVAELRDDLEQSLKESWGEAYRAALGSALTVSRKQPKRPYLPRNAPRVYLDNHPVTNEAIKEYLVAWQTGEVTPAVYKMLREAPTGDPPHAPYLEFFAQAYVLGVTNRWQISAVTSALAISVARDYRERFPEDASKHRITGREAAFWRAYALRSSAKTADDLHRARAALRLARQYGQEDMADAHGELDFKPIRFDAEDLAIDVVEMCFELFSENAQPKTSPIIIAKATQLLSKASLHMDRLCEQTELPELLARDAYNAFSFQRIITNYFMVALSIQRDHPADLAVVRRYLAQFDILVGCLKSVPTYSLSYLVLIIYETARVIFSSDEEQRSKARREFRALYTKVADNGTMPYDGNRFQFLSELVRTSN